MNVDFIDMLDGYKAENDELLQKMEDALMDIQENGMNDENINAVFRAAHTIKGSSGMFGIDYIVAFTHIAENLLDKIRNHKIEMNEEIIELLLACKDQMQTLIDFVMSDPEGQPDEETQSLSDTLISQLQLYLDGKASKNAKVIGKTEDEALTQEVLEILSDANVYKIEITFSPDTFSHGFDTFTFIKYLEELGDILSITTNTEAIPHFQEIDPVKCYMSYTIDFSSKKEEAAIYSAFEFVKEGSDISITNLSTPKEETTEEEIEELLILKQSEEKKKKEEPKSASTAVKQSNFIRIEAEKVDSLINLIGEMVISNATVMQYASNIRHSELIEAVSTVTRMLEEVRENAMQIRMVPIGETFNKFKRIVHDTANKVGKQVDLVIRGGDTELDKTVIEKIADPLVHLIRNSVDHGIEDPKTREAAGKKKSGVLELNAYQDAGSIVIEIVDDGKGLDEEILLQKGIEKGLVEANHELTQKEVFNLILQPGFSTAAQVTDISGRGVGMDVVNRNISDLHGTIEIQSQKLKGTKVIIRLPLTLAIIDGFLTKVGNANIIIPLDMIVECIALTKNAKVQMRKNSYINLRGRVLPLLNISSYFKIPSSNTQRSNIVVIQYAGQNMGIVVDELLGELQTVIKPLGILFQELKSFSGSTILGSGEVALIMDVPVMLKIMSSYQKKELAA